jgi:hypothetical protein
MMSGAAPGRCADCGSDAYIQLAVEDAMLCAHCYADRLGLTKLVAARVAARKGGEPAIPKSSPMPKLASLRRRAS